MRYKPDHKAQTHARILKVANRRFREEGFELTTIPEVMEDAGLTHGGFYGHFGSKDTLIRESILAAFHDSIAVLFAKLEGFDQTTQWAKVVRRYLSDRHRESLADGCLMPALSGEVARMSDDHRQQYEHGFKEFVAAMSAYLPERAGSTDQERTDKEQQAIAMLALMVGGVLLSRAVFDPAYSDRILEACRQASLRDTSEPKPDNPKPTPAQSG